MPEEHTSTGQTGRRPILTRWTVPTPPQDATPHLCVLSSSSGGNCSLVRYIDAGRPRHLLIDLGLSPKRTRELLSLFEIKPKDIDAVLMTHLDMDHCHPGWGCPPGKVSHLRDDCPVLVHTNHLAEARERYLHRPNLRPFGSEEFEPLAGVVVQAALLAHDEEGTASFRLDLPGGGRLGYATDIGRLTDDLLALIKEVCVLAIESNYCPVLQAGSSRPEFLKRRITGGAGHLSNEEAMHAVQTIQPRDHVVLLHLSRECNRVDLVASMHEGADYGWTIAEPDRPSRWVRIGPRPLTHTARPANASQVDQDSQVDQRSQTAAAATEGANSGYLSSTLQ